jgi:hypothetical protein
MLLVVIKVLHLVRFKFFIVVKSHIVGLYVLTSCSLMFLHYMVYFAEDDSMSVYFVPTEVQ